MAEGDDGKRDGMRRAEEHADPHWKACMLQCAELVARAKPIFDSEDVKRLCQKLHPNATTHEMKAIGPLMRSLIKPGIALPFVDNFNKSTWAACHRRPMQAWRSMIYDGPQPQPAKRRKKGPDPRQYSFDFDAAANDDDDEEKTG